MFKKKKAKLKIFHYNFFPKNRKGAMEIVLVVFLVALVIFVALFNFVVNTPYVKVNVYDARFIEEVYQKQDLAEFYIRQAGESVKNSDNFEEDFKKEFSKYGFVWSGVSSHKKLHDKENYLNELKQIISENRFSVDFEGDFLIVEVNSLLIEESFDSIQIKYFPKLSVVFDLED